MHCTAPKLPDRSAGGGGHPQGARAPPPPPPPRGAGGGGGAPNPRAVQLMLGHAEIESTVWYLGIEVDDAQVMFEKADF